MAEVKPVDLDEAIRTAIMRKTATVDIPAYAKAIAYSPKYAVICLGLMPIKLLPFAPIGIILSVLPRGITEEQMAGIMDHLTVTTLKCKETGKTITAEAAWRLAGSETQWEPDCVNDCEPPMIDVRRLVKNAIERAAAREKEAVA